MGRSLNLAGQRFVRLVALRPTDERQNGGVVWLCLCDCGNECKVNSYCLRSGQVKSCGCLQKERTRKAKTTHGCRRDKKATTEYDAWRNMKARCSNCNKKDFKNYGGRGISVCNRWLDSFENFLEDMGKKTSSELSIERIDNNGNYEPGNCKWGTHFEQAANTRNLKRFRAFNEKTGEAYESNNQAKFARQYGLCLTGISGCLTDRRKSHKGWRFQYA